MGFFGFFLVGSFAGFFYRGLGVCIDMGRVYIYFFFFFFFFSRAGF